MFSKLLIANRGEIACRIMKTAKKLGIETVAIYSTADETAQHVKQADEAYCLGAPEASESYLNIDKIISIAKQAGVDAIHPGYGFLSENPKFARACNANKITFVGPPIKAMELMASKQRAKACLETTDVPLTPGYHGKSQTEAELLKAAKKIGFPVLLKAAAGGGGKGMRQVDDEKAFKEALLGAKREAKASFGDDTMLIEKLIEEPRHVEMQIMADSKGNVVHLFERDCSIQRRHQKIIEEAPAPNLPKSLRASLAKAAVEVAQTINYQGAGTIEFLVDKHHNFYFMEMNTRLQVEHPVTEMITGLDLVEWQLHIAYGEPLPLQQKEIKATGHAIECRIYAEDTDMGGLPSTGKLRVFETPTQPGIRLDTGFVDSDTITQYYDPMLGKLVAHGETRDEAIQKLHTALMHYQLGGLKTNIHHLKAMLECDAFKKVKLATNFLTINPLQSAKLSTLHALMLRAAISYFDMQPQSELFKNMLGFHNGGNMTYPCYYEIDDTRYAVHITPINHDTFACATLDETHTLTVLKQQDHLIITTASAKHLGYFDAATQMICTAYGNVRVIEVQSPNKSVDDQNLQASLNAPMPATVVAILKAAGDEVKAGDDLMVLEAMKMEHTIRAPENGKLTDIFYKVGAQVDEGAKLVRLDGCEK